MIIVDKALKEREAKGCPIRVGMIGAGFMGQGLTNQIINSTPGMRMSVVQNRNLDRAFHVYQYSGLENITRVDSQRQLDDSVLCGNTRSPSTTAT